MGRRNRTAMYTCYQLYVPCFDVPRCLHGTHPYLCTLFMCIRIASSLSIHLLVSVVDLVPEFHTFALILHQLHERIGSSCFGFRRFLCIWFINCRHCSRMKNMTVIKYVPSLKLLSFPLLHILVD